MQAGARKSPARRSRGRPPAEPSRDVRGALLKAARELFLERPYRDVPVRRLAARAGVNPAMVGYYFGDKQGLYSAMLREVIGPLAARIEGAVVAPGDAPADLAAFLREYMRVVAAHPWLPRLILRDVLAPDGAFRERFVRDFAGRVAPKMAAVAGRGGTLRPGLDPTLTIISMLSLGLWPFLAMPVLEQALGFGRDEADIERLIDHTVRLFQAGTASGAP